jgi:hypothetical protein
MLATYTTYSANLFNYFNLSQPDNSGMLRFLTDELQDAEDQGDRGVSLKQPLVVYLLTSAASLDSRSRPQRLGWDKWTRITYESLYVSWHLSTC